MADRLLEYRRVRSDAAQPILFDQFRKPATLQQIPAHKIEPHRLPVFLKSPQGIGHDHYSLRASCSLAAAYRLSPLKPNLTNSFLCRTEAPTVRIPRIVTPNRAYRS